MGKSYKDFLLVSDMDGTLIGTDGKVPQKNKDAIADFVAGGGRFAIATGRTPSNGEQFFAGVAVNSPCIFYNGAMLYDWQAKKTLKTCALAGDIWRRFAAACLRDFPMACIEVYTEDDCCILSDPAQDDPRLAYEFHQYSHVQLADIVDAVWLKFFVCAPRPVLEMVQQAAAEAGIAALSTSFYSSPVYLEFVDRGVSKGDMLEVLRRLPENAGRYVVAAGDFPNDNEMLRHADCGIAPANAEPETRAAADRIGVSCDEGLWHHIIYDVLPELRL